MWLNCKLFKIHALGNTCEVSSVVVKTWLTSIDASEDNAILLNCDFPPIELGIHDQFAISLLYHENFIILYN